MGGMPDLDLAHHFLAAHGRVLDLRRFERLFLGGDAAPVRAAVAAYRNADGGFGQALEPDGRTPHSQPAATEQALKILDQADAWDDELAAGACDQLQATAPPEGGAVFVAPSVEGWPHAPWWQPAPGASLISTGQIARHLARPPGGPSVGGERHGADVEARRRARRPRRLRPLRRPALPRPRAGPRPRRGHARARRARAAQHRHARSRGARRDPRPARVRAAPGLARSVAVQRRRGRRRSSTTSPPVSRPTAAGRSTSRPGLPPKRRTGAAPSRSTRSTRCGATSARSD